MKNEEYTLTMSDLIWYMSELSEGRETIGGCSIYDMRFETPDGLQVQISENGRLVWSKTGDNVELNCINIQLNFKQINKYSRLLFINFLNMVAQNDTDKIYYTADSGDMTPFTINSLDFACHDLSTLKFYKENR